MTSTDVLRPPPSDIKSRIKAWLMNWAMAHVGTVFRLLRAVWPIPHFGKFAAVTRYDDVKEVFASNSKFSVTYQAKLEVIMGKPQFFLGIDDDAQHNRATDAMRTVVRPADIPVRLVPAVLAAAEQAVAKAGGRIEVVDALVRQVTFDVLCDYFGTPDPPGADMRVWATRLFEFQFADPGNDPVLRKEVDVIAPAMQAHIQNLIDERKKSRGSKDDVLGRCIDKQAQGEPGFSDDDIRSALIGFVVGGLPQPPMVVPQALEQLLRRPAILAEAQQAAKDNDDKLLAGYLFEAMRFDPLAPGLMRIAAVDRTIAAATPRATKVAKGTSVLVAFSSAMMDERRIPEPRRFNPRRLPHEYMHFGFGMHTCFGIHINQALLPLMLKPLLKKDKFRRAPGRAGHLTKRGAFADTLSVEYLP